MQTHKTNRMRTERRMGAGDEEIGDEGGESIERDGITGMNSPIRLEESDFHERVDAMLTSIEYALESSDTDIDSEINSGILTLEFDNRSKMIINRQTPNRELWVAAKSGGFHFHFDGAVWRDTRSNESLESLLSRVISEQSGSVISITL